MSPKKAQVTKIFFLTEDVFEIHFRTEEPLEFKAGQFVTIKIADKIPPCFRAYSIASAPQPDCRNIKTCVKIVAEGRGSNWLKSLKAGTKINFIGPSGKFTFKNPDKNSFFIATGTGVTPFLSMIEDQLKSGNKNKIHLLFGLRHIKNIIYKDFLEQLRRQYPNFSYEITLSKPENSTWKGSTGRVSQILNTQNIDTKNTDYYICGLKEMIADVAKILKEKSVPESAIHFEQYD
ncbi:FAD-dependent oxidoreductase [Candidatus Peregrinibacteria bacterium]|nr:FAD-dependent oxidoreductase [Candidatus Peregrinibacteria bacterium]